VKSEKRGKGDLATKDAKGGEGGRIFQRGGNGGGEARRERRRERRGEFEKMENGGRDRQSFEIYID
jgi:hypothetical protein